MSRKVWETVGNVGKSMTKSKEIYKIWGKSEELGKPWQKILMNIVRFTIPVRIGAIIAAFKI